MYKCSINNPHRVTTQFSPVYNRLASTCTSGSLSLMWVRTRVYTNIHGHFHCNRGLGFLGIQGVQTGFEAGDTLGFVLQPFAFNVHFLGADEAVCGRWCGGCWGGDGGCRVGCGGCWGGGGGGGGGAGDGGSGAGGNKVDNDYNNDHNDHKDNNDEDVDDDND